MKLTKTQIDFWCFGGYYQFRIFKILDAHKQTYYTGEPVGHGGTKIADTLDELKVLLESEVEILNDFLRKTR